MKKVQIHKSIGGHDTCVKVHGRWHWVGMLSERLAMYKVGESAGVAFERVPGEPATIRRLFITHGGKLSSLIDHLPKWTPEVGF